MAHPMPGRGDAAARRGALPVDGDLEMNMTPMIDIVFQLIVFFMLQLKFKEIDRQIDSNLPRDRGPVASNFVTPPLSIEVHAARRGLEGGEVPVTRLRIGRSHEILLPDALAGDPGERAAALDRLRRVLREKALLAEAGTEGHLYARPPTGGLIPHGDAMAVVDAFLAAGITDVTFEGAGR